MGKNSQKKQNIQDFMSMMKFSAVII